MSSLRLDTSGARPVLLKQATGAAGRSRLGHEADMLLLARHPSVVEIDDYVDDGTTATLALVPVAGSTVDRLGVLDPAEAAGLVADLASTLADLHALGVVHGRVRPDHVILTPDGRTVLCGFADATATSQASGVEDAPATPLDPSLDVRGLGRLLAGLVGPSTALPIPDRRRMRLRHQDCRAALLTLADLAEHHDPAARPTAAGLAERILTLVPDARSPRTLPEPRPPDEVVPGAGERCRHGDVDGPTDDPRPDPAGSTDDGPTRAGAAASDAPADHPSDVDRPSGGDGAPSDDGTLSGGATGGEPDRQGPTEAATTGDRWPDDWWPDDRWPDDRWPDDRWPDDRWPDDRWPDDRWPDDRWPDDRWPDDRWSSDGTLDDDPAAAVAPSTPDDADRRSTGRAAEGSEPPDRPTIHGPVTEPRPIRPATQLARPRPDAARSGRRWGRVAAAAALIGAAVVLAGRTGWWGAADRAVTVSSRTGVSHLGRQPSGSTSGGGTPTPTTDGHGTGAPTTGTPTTGTPTTGTPTTGDRAGAGPPPTSSTIAPTPAAAPAPATSAPCGVADGPDVDGDGCGDAVTVDGGTVTTPRHRFVVGGPDDQVVVGDWDCDGLATPALLRRPGGEVFVFASWAAPGRELTVPASATTGEGGELVALPSASPGCATLVVRRPGQPDRSVGERTDR